MKLISIVMPCFNEQDNVIEVYHRVRMALLGFSRYKFEFIFIDNASTDDTESQLRELAAKDKSVKVILNSRNFGHIRSPFYGMIQARGDAVISMVSDLQDPPELLPQFIQKWEE